ncbi:MAG: STAS domain-containing protein [Candidatus Anammoximicrobium sp.]|nr:STAS domain-containing protein [Candidatus Anammoximicrobium sp.]
MAEITLIEKDGVHIVAFLDSSLFEEGVVVQRRREIEELVAQHAVTRLLLDLSSIQLAGSAALGMLIRLKSRCTPRNCHMALCGLQPPVREALRVTQLDKIFEIYEGVNSALAALQNANRAAPGA